MPAEASLVRALLEATDDIVYVKDLQGRYLHVSPAALRAIGRSEAEVLGRTVHDLFAPERAAQLEALERERIAVGTSDAVEAAFALDDEFRLYSIRVTPLRERGELVGWIGTARDVTARHTAETERDHSLSRYVAALDATADGIVVVRSDGRIVSVNKRFIEMWRMPEDLLAVRGNDDAVLSFVLDQVARPDEFLPTLREHHARPEEESFDVLHLRDGRVFERYSIPQRLGGTAIGRVWSFRDVTERSLVEAAREEQARFEAALAKVGQELIASLAAPTLLPRLCRLVTEVLETDGSTSLLRTSGGRGYTVAANVGRSDEDRETIQAMGVAVEKVPGFLRLGDADVIHGTTDGLHPLEQAFLERFGVRSWLCMALRKGDELIGMQLAGRGADRPPFGPREVGLAKQVARLASLAIENARLVDELERASRLKSEFVATMSHELRTPLNIIIGYQDLFAEGAFGETTAEQAEILGRLQLKSRELLHLVEATLDLSRIEAGRLRLELGPVALPALLQEIDNETRELRSGRSIEFVWQIEGDVSGFHSDGAKLKVILKNLVTNAFKFTEAGSVAVLASALGNEALEIRVRDTGIGIEPSSVGVIFEPFRQVDASPTRRYGGVGLGLHIVRRLTEMLGGTISVETRKGEGSCFRLVLPIDARPWQRRGI